MDSLTFESLCHCMCVGGRGEEGGGWVGLSHRLGSFNSGLMHEFFGVEKLVLNFKITSPTLLKLKSGPVKNTYLLLRRHKYLVGIDHTK